MRTPAPCLVLAGSALAARPHSRVARSFGSAEAAPVQCTSPSNIAPGSLTAPDGCSWYAEIAAGDTCNSILAKYPTALSLKAFLLANPSVNAQCTNLVPGQSYCVSGPIELSPGSLTIEEGCVKTRVIQKGDTCQGIVSSIGDITLSDFYRFNPQLHQPSCDNLIAGLQYCTCDGGKGSVKPTTSAPSSPAATASPPAGGAAGSPPASTKPSQAGSPPATASTPGHGGLIPNGPGKPPVTTTASPTSGGTVPGSPAHSPTPTSSDDDDCGDDEPTHSSRPPVQTPPASSASPPAVSSSSLSPTSTVSVPATPGCSVDMCPGGAAHTVLEGQDCLAVLQLCLHVDILHLIDIDVDVSAAICADFKPVVGQQVCLPHICPVPNGHGVGTAPPPSPTCSISPTSTVSGSASGSPAPTPTPSSSSLVPAPPATTSTPGSPATCAGGVIVPQGADCLAVIELCINVDLLHIIDISAGVEAQICAAFPTVTAGQCFVCPTLPGLPTGSSPPGLPSGNPPPTSTSNSVAPPAPTPSSCPGGVLVPDSCDCLAVIKLCVHANLLDLVDVSVGVAASLLCAHLPTPRPGTCFTCPSLPSLPPAHSPPPPSHSPPPPSHSPPPPSHSPPPPSHSPPPPSSGHPPAPGHGGDEPCDENGNPIHPHPPASSPPSPPHQAPSPPPSSPPHGGQGGHDDEPCDENGNPIKGGAHGHKGKRAASRRGRALRS